MSTSTRAAVAARAAATKNLALSSTPLRRQSLVPTVFKTADRKTEGTSVARHLMSSFEALQKEVAALKDGVIAGLQHENNELRAQLQELKEQLAAQKCLQATLDTNVHHLLSKAEAAPTPKKIEILSQSLQKQIEGELKAARREMEKLHDSVAKATANANEALEAARSNESAAQEAEQPWQSVPARAGRARNNAAAKKLRLVPVGHQAQLPTAADAINTAQRVLSEVVQQPVMPGAVALQPFHDKARGPGAIVATLSPADASRVLAGLKGGKQPSGWRISTHLEGPLLARKRALLSVFKQQLADAATAGTRPRFSDNMESVHIGQQLLRLPDDELAKIKM